MTMICTQILATQKNTNSGWELRGSYDSLAKGGCPQSAELAQFNQCVSQLEAFELKDDPAAPQRRAAAKDRAAATRQQPDFKAIIDDWTRALDGKNITCRNRDVSDSDARECERWHGEMTKLEDRLAAYLVGRATTSATSGRSACGRRTRTGARARTSYAFVGPDHSPGAGWRPSAGRSRGRP